MSSPTYNTEFDVIVIGGGSGGLALSKECSKHGLKTALFDYATPSRAGNSYMAFSTCVSAGCIPKKLFHEAANIGDAIEDSQAFGWTVEKPATADWEAIRDAIISNIRGTNWVYRVELRNKGVVYKNEFATFVDNETIKGTDKSGKESLYKAKHIVIGTGLRPAYLNIPGAEHAITSDDVFFLDEAPGKTLCVGASYISLETAGWIHGLGWDATVMVRSVPLRNFDQQMAGHVVNFMKNHGIKFLEKSEPSRIELLENGMKRVYYNSPEGEQFDDFNTVLFAIGRVANPTALGAQNTTIALDRAGRVIVDEFDRTNVPNVYCIGDMASGRPELTPVAIASGRGLAQRLAGLHNRPTDISVIPTAVFTPMEYGSIGISEEAAKEQYGDDSDAFLMTYKPYAWVLSGRGQCLAKVVVQKSTDKVLGMHICGPQAGEIIQGYATAMMMGVTKTQLDATIQLHPTTSERLIGLEISRSSGASFESATCCG